MFGLKALSKRFKSVILNTTMMSKQRGELVLTQVCR